MFKTSSIYLKRNFNATSIRGNGTATYCKISGVDVAAKTGTTDEIMIDGYVVLLLIIQQ